ncbi:MAG: fluoride efflux transporter CrcB [bacterium]|nr:fluoride efflux transporter CrcB [bacterium]
MGGLLVFLGGGFGALIRYFLYLILPKNCAFPLGTLCANFFGCFIATVVFTYFITKGDLHPHYKILLITGFCGGLSTLSALSLEVLCFIQSGEYLKAALYILTSLLICVISVILGVALVKKYV